MRSLILASQSPRRADLLTQMGFDFTITAADVDESALIKERPRQLVSRLAQLKAQTISMRSNNDILNQNVVLAADTLRPGREHNIHIYNLTKTMQQHCKFNFLYCLIFSHVLHF